MRCYHNSVRVFLSDRIVLAGMLVQNELPEIRTARLLLRDWRPDDLAPFAVMNASMTANKLAYAIAIGAAAACSCQPPAWAAPRVQSPAFHVQHFSDWAVRGRDSSMGKERSC